MDKRYLEAANQAEPELMQKTAQALSLIEKLAPEFLPDVLQEFETIASVTTEKLAAAPSAASSRVFSSPVGQAAIGVAASIGVGVAASLGSAIAADLFDTAKRGLTKARDLRRIMASNPKLREEVNDPERLKPAFNALHHYAPDLMKDPLVGGSLLKSLANQAPGNEHVLIRDLIGSRKNLVDIRNNQFRLDLREMGKKQEKKEGPLHYHLHQEEGKGRKVFGFKKGPRPDNTPGSTPTND